MSDENNKRRKEIEAMFREAALLLGWEPYLVNKYGVATLYIKTNILFPLSYYSLMEYELLIANTELLLTKRDSEELPKQESEG